MTYSSSGCCLCRTTAAQIGTAFGPIAVSCHCIDATMEVMIDGACCGCVCQSVAVLVQSGDGFGGEWPTKKREKGRGIARGQGNKYLKVRWGTSQTSQRNCNSFKVLWPMETNGIDKRTKSVKSRDGMK